MNDLFLRACRREPVERTPVWFLRQAGRYMAEYREIRKKHSLLEICRTPELASAVTLQPVTKLGVDAAILFSDLLVPLEPLGVPVEFIAGEGPVISDPLRNAEQIASLHDFDPREELFYTMEAIRLLRQELTVPLVGFAGAPFTLASYAVEGGASRHYEHTKCLMYNDTSTWHRLAELLAGVVTSYLTAQVEAGAQAVQLFDSWVGALSPSDYREFVLPHSQSILSALSKLGVPVIHFGTGTAGILELLHEAGGDVIGVDWRVELGWAWDHIGRDVAIQGNLDPLLLHASEATLFRAADHVLASAGDSPGHIFNLGHGILPNTSVERVKALVEHVHRVTERS